MGECVLQSVFINVKHYAGVVLRTKYVLGHREVKQCGLSGVHFITRQPHGQFMCFFDIHLTFNLALKKLF